MTFRPPLFAFSFLLSITLIGCGGSEADTDGDDMSNVPFTRDVSLDTSLVTIMQSVNLCDWRSAVNSNQKGQEDHSIYLKEVYKGRIESNLVVSVCDVENLALAEDYLNSTVHMGPYLQVSEDGNMKYHFLDQQLEYTKETKDTLVFYMHFKTMKYERWEKAFLDDYRENPEHEFEVTHVFRGIDEPNRVHMIFLANDPNYVERMEKNNSFRMKMLAAGVVSYPETYKLVRSTEKKGGK